jgi:hypothetical protein
MQFNKLLELLPLCYARKSNNKLQNFARKEFCNLLLLRC